MNVYLSKNFDKFFKKLTKNNPSLKEKIIGQFEKIRENPEIGKPMRHSRKGTREVYIAPFRLSYAYFKNEDKIVFLDLYHKDEQ